MINVLINAYAVSPNWGSEPGMGWNWVINIANHCNVHVITEGEWKKEIEIAVANLPQKENIHFYYLPVSEKVRQMCWNQGDWRFYWHYRKWQRRAYHKALEIIANNKIDILHQLNMIGFREPGYLWKIKDIPFVWGPVGGMGTIPTAYLKGAGWAQNLFCRIKNTISDLQARFSPGVRAAARRGIMIAATSDVKKKVQLLYKKSIPLINETGCYPHSSEIKSNVKDCSDTFNVLWVGKFDFRKQFDLALRALHYVENNERIVLHVVSPFTSEQQRRKIEKKITADNLNKQVVLHGKVSHDKVMDMMKASHILLFTSIMEGTPHVVLEAIQNSLPVVCLDTCGHGDVVSEEIGVKLPLSNPDKSAHDIAEVINSLMNDPVKLRSLSNNCEKRQQSVSWDGKVAILFDLYSDLVN